MHLVCPKYSTLGHVSCTLELGLGSGFRFGFFSLVLGFFKDDIYKVQTKCVG